MSYRRFRFQYKQTITTVLARSEEDYRRAVKGMLYARERIEEYIALNPLFLTALEPIECDDRDVISRMCRAARVANVGPMAAVAATVAWYGVEFSESEFMVIDNGGDIVMRVDEPLTVGVYAGKKRTIGFEVEGDGKLKAICTSSGKIGPSISFGFADAATVFSDDPAIADACATALGNEIKEDFGRREVEEVVEEFWREKRSYVDGILVVKDDIMVMAGDVPELKVVEIDPEIITKG
ncbi:hypothetical protein GAH_01961 [Geoglobus ahangari]|uniref:Uncharacterized protein n=1 Tax=Geoglobus ahangari TaxID=113653 RepID=A0A0F7DBA8_9EURY|nr:UPF0280 family protein [Geoglobus ahangari]AKG90766.1 hypothetical protein GAH_01961 [Geoglobus ahangari]